MNNLVQAAVERFREAKYPIALTGAGISTPSGIPDFRSADSGVWGRVDPFEVASLWGFTANPKAFFNWIRPLAKTVLEAQPNPAHLALAQMEKAGWLHCIITQNIDMLHTRAGSRVVYEVHGHLRDGTCMDCKKIYPIEQFSDDFLRYGNVPTCPACRGVVKPNVILFGEALPSQDFDAAHAAVEHCDLMLVAGSSLQVAPVSDLPDTALRHKAALIIVNREATALDSRASVVIHDDVAKILPQIADALEAGEK